MDYDQMDEWEQQQHDDGEFLEKLEAFLREHYAELTVECRDEGRDWRPNYVATICVSRGDREILDGLSRLPRQTR
jgi:hypothetical protein